MTTTHIIGGTVAAVALGLWLRRSSRPVVISYRIGLAMGHLEAKAPRSGRDAR